VRTWQKKKWEQAEGVYFVLKKQLTTGKVSAGTFKSVAL
jgi:hypothetical protein